MREGDLIFMDDRVIAKAARGMHFVPGHEVSIHLPSKVTRHTFGEGPVDDTPKARLRCIFDLGGVRHWAVRIDGKAGPEQLMRSGWFMPYESEPGPSPAGMVTALDLVISQSIGHGMVDDHLRRMRSHFASIAKER